MADKKSIRDLILEAKDLEPEPVDIPEWGVSGFIHPLDGEALYRLSKLAANMDSNKNTHIVEAYVCEGLYDEDGEQVFSIDDRAELARKNPTVVMRLYERVLSVSNMGDEAEADLEKK